jgi:hypothetical protein
MLKLSSTPAAILAKAQTGVAAFLDDEIGYAESGSDTFDITRGHPLYVTPLDDFVEGNLIAGAQFSSWQFIVLRQRNEFGLAEVAPEDDDNVFEFAGLGLGPYATSLPATISIAEELPEVAARAYELRVLLVPPLYLYCVWLHADDDDLLLACDPAPEPLIPNVILRPEEVVSALRAFASFRLRVADSDI